MSSGRRNYASRAWRVEFVGVGWWVCNIIGCWGWRRPQLGYSALDESITRYPEIDTHTHTHVYKTAFLSLSLYFLLYFAWHNYIARDAFSESMDRATDLWFVFILMIFVHIFKAFIILMTRFYIEKTGNCQI